MKLELSQLDGLCQKIGAPDFIASTAMSISPWAVMMMMGGRNRLFFRLIQQAGP